MAEAKKNGLATPEVSSERQRLASRSPSELCCRNWAKLSCFAPVPRMVCLPRTIASKSGGKNRGSGGDLRRGASRYSRGHGGTGGLDRRNPPGNAARAANLLESGAGEIHLSCWTSRMSISFCGGRTVSSERGRGKRFFPR